MGSIFKARENLTGLTSQVCERPRGHKSRRAVCRKRGKDFAGAAIRAAFRRRCTQGEKETSSTDYADLRRFSLLNLIISANL
jgi:hypothetical protein